MMNDTPEPQHSSPSSWTSRVGVSAGGAVMGGLAGATVAVVTTELIKRILAEIVRQDTWVILTVPLVGTAIAVAILHGLARGEAVQRLDKVPPKRLLKYGPTPFWYTFKGDVARADLTGDVVKTAGEEEKFPWHLAPVRALAIVSTVALGAPMGTEAPAAHLGVAAGSWVGSGERLRRFVRPAGVAGGAAGVSALMGIPLVGTVFMLELGRRRNAPLSVERVVAALVGGLVGWAINVGFNLSLIRLVVPKIPPSDLLDAVLAALFVGAIAGAITSLTGTFIYKARGWSASPTRRLIFGGLAMFAGAAAVAAIASPGAAIGPGGGAIVWAETTENAALTLLAIALLRAAMTTAAVAAGGCGGVFVPFLAIGDIAGRVFAGPFGVPADLAGAAGAAAGIAGGYRLPFTAFVMVLGVGGPAAATATCVATVGVASVAAVGASRAVAWVSTVTR
jgi:chloride channel protein, CIC family